MGLKLRARPSQQRGWTRHNTCQANRRPHPHGMSAAKHTLSLEQPHAQPPALPREEEAHQGHKRSDNPQVAPEWAASQQSHLSGAAGVGRGSINHASALSKYFTSQIHAAYLINPHRYFRGLTRH